MSALGEWCARCGTTRTPDKLGEMPICEECRLTLLAHQEERRTCSSCDCEMRKLIVEVVVVDKCPSCHGVWLDAGELELLQRSIQKKRDLASLVLSKIVLG